MKVLTAVPIPEAGRARSVSDLHVSAHALGVGPTKQVSKPLLLVLDFGL